MSKKPAHCPRCDATVRAVRPWRHWGKLRYIYFGVLGLALLGSPVILADGFVMIPTLMVFMAAIGPINNLAKLQPTCVQCGGVVEDRLQTESGHAEALRV